MDSQPPNRYAKSTRPVNARTARPLPEPVATVHPLVEQRIAAQRAKNRLGAPLADLLGQQQRLHTARAGRLPPRPGRQMVGFGALAMAIAGSGLLYAAMQQSPWGITAATTGVLAAVALVYAGRKASRLAGNAALPGSDAAAAFNPVTPLWDEASITALDKVVAELAAVLPTAAASELSAIKLQLARIQKQTMGLATGGDEHFTIDDRLYLMELVRRYLPDTLQSYLAVPDNQRNATIGNEGNSGNTATSLLLSQLQMLRLELDKKETKLALSRTEALQRQQRFLQSKSSR